ncbi:MAG: WD40 repeat domain-containing protein, partial [Planctomycetaceae bacterium]
KPKRTEKKARKNLPPRRSASAKSKSPRPKETKQGRWLTVGIGTIACIVFGYLIIGALNKDEPKESVAIPTDETNATREATAETTTPEPSPTRSGTNSVPPPAPPAIPPPKTFFTAAVNAPPRTKKQLTALPTAISPLAPVTNPLPLPGVRSWTFETIAYKDRTYPALSIDAKLVAMGGIDGSIRVVDMRTARLERLIIMPGQVRKLEWLADGQTLLTYDGATVFRVNVESGKVTPELGLIGGHWSLSSDRQRLYAIPRGSKKLNVYAVTDFSITEEIDLSSDHETVRISRDDRLLATSSTRTIDVFENTRPLKRLTRISRRADLISHVWSDTGLLATGWSDGRVAIYDLKSPSPTPISETHAYHKGYTHVHCWAWLDNDTLLMTGTSDTLDHYSVEKKKKVATFRSTGWTAPLTYSAKHNTGVICGKRADLLVNGRPKSRLVQGDWQFMRSMTFNHDGSQILTAGTHSDKYDLTTGARTSLLEGGRTGPPYTGVSLSSGNRLLCYVAERYVDAFPSVPHRPSSVVRFGFKPDWVYRTVWVENEAAVLVCARSGLTHCQLANGSKNRLIVPNDEDVMDVAWDEKNRVAVVLGTEHLFEWDPRTNLVRHIRKLPKGCNANIEINQSSSHLAIAGESIAVLSTKAYETVLTPNWTKPFAQWLSPTELVAVTHEGRQLQRLSLTSPQAMTSVQIPLSGFLWRESLTFSKTAPVGAGMVGGNQVRFFDTRNGAHLGSIMVIGPNDYATFTPDGRIVGSSKGFQKQIVYQIKTDEGQQTLTSEEFFRRFGKHF